MGENEKNARKPGPGEEFYVPSDRQPGPQQKKSALGNPFAGGYRVKEIDHKGETITFERETDTNK